MLHKNKYSNLDNDDFCFIVGDYTKKSPKMKNRDYKFLTELTGRYNDKLSNGVMMYEILRLFDVGSSSDIIDEHEKDINKQLGEHLFENEINGIDEFTTISKNQAKSNLKSFYQNNYQHTNEDCYFSRQRTFRLPDEFIEKSEELQGRYTKTLVDNIHKYVQSPYRTRSHRIDIKKEILEYLENDNVEFEYDVTKNVIYDVLGEDVDTVSNNSNDTTDNNTTDDKNTDDKSTDDESTDDSISEPENENNVNRKDKEVDIDSFNCLGDYMEKGSKIDKWDKRFKAIDNVLEGQDVRKSQFVTILSKSHDIDKNWAKRKLNKFESEYKEFDEYKRDKIDITDDDIDKYTRNLNQIVNDRMKEIKCAKSLERKFDKVDSSNMIDVLDSVVKNSTQVQFEFDSKLGNNFVSEY